MKGESELLRSNTVCPTPPQSGLVSLYEVNLVCPSKKKGE